MLLVVFSPQLYVTFWALSMFDLYVPSERYEQELSKLKQQQAQLDDNKDMVCPALFWVHGCTVDSLCLLYSDCSALLFSVAELKLILDVSVLLSLQPVSKKKKEKERCSLLVEKLKEEFKQQEEHNQRVMASLKHERDSWLPASKYILALFLEESVTNFWKGIFLFGRISPWPISQGVRKVVQCSGFFLTNQRRKQNHTWLSNCVFSALFTLGADWLIA